MAVIPSIQVTGKSNLLIAFPYDYTDVHRIGEQISDTTITAEPVMHNVYGDSQGGQEGDPIERQILALRYTASFNLSKWSPAIRAKIEQHNAMAKEGHFSDAEIGALTLRDRSFRLIISPSKSSEIPSLDPVSGDAHPDAGADWFYRNFCCTTLSSPIETGVGTKWAALRFSMQAFRVPEGHALAPGTDGADYADGLIWNRDATGVADQYLPESMKVA
tara:strand:- start:245 stop:898 length:654 start_codon:yes stop_codon:yes gene_type:complete